MSAPVVIAGKLGEERLAQIFLELETCHPYASPYVLAMTARLRFLDEARQKARRDEAA